MNIKDLHCDGGVLVSYAPTEDEVPYGQRHPEGGDQVKMAYERSVAANEVPKMAHVRQSRPDSGLGHQANMAHIRQSRPFSGLDHQMKVPKPSELFPLRSDAAVRIPEGGGGASADGV